MVAVCKANLTINCWFQAILSCDALSARLHLIHVCNCTLLLHWCGLQHVPLSYLQLVRLIHSHLEERRDREMDRRLYRSKWWCSLQRQEQNEAPDRQEFKRDSWVYCGTSFCLFSSFCQLAAAVLTPGFLLSSHHRRLLVPAAHIDTHRRLCPQGDPSCGRTIKRREIGSHQNPLAPVFKRRLVMSWAAQWNPIKRNAAQAAGACLQGVEAVGGVMFPFPFLSSGECSACWHAVKAATLKSYCGRTDTKQCWCGETDRQPN